MEFDRHRRIVIVDGKFNIYSGKCWFSLGPAAARLALQELGIGPELADEAIDALRNTYDQAA